MLSRGAAFNMPKDFFAIHAPTCPAPGRYGVARGVISRTDGFTAGTPGRGGFSAASLQRGAHRASKAGSPLRVESDRGTPDRRLTGPAANHRRAESDTAERGSRRGSAGREIRSAPGIVWVALIAVLVAGPGCAAGADPAMAPDPAPGPARALEPALDATEPTEAEDDAGESADVEPVFTVADSRSAEPEFSNPDQAIAGEEVAEDEEQVDGEPARPRLTEDQRRELQLLLSVLRTNQLDAEQRRLAAETLLGRGWREAVEAMAADLRNGEPSTRRLIAEAVVRKSDPPAGLVDPLLAALQAESSDLREAVASALARYPADTVVPQIGRASCRERV